MIWELSDWEFKMIMTDLLNTLMEKVDDMQERMGNISGETETLRKNKKEMLDKKKLTNRMPLMDAFVSNRLDTANCQREKNWWV